MKNSCPMILLLVFACTLISFTGCSSIVSGTTDDITISSTPGAATYKVRKIINGNEIMSGSTPATITLPRKYEYTVLINLPGYKERVIPITQEFNGWVIGNLICGGIPGGVIDALTGALWRLDPTSISVNMDKAYLENGTIKYYAVLHAVDAEGNPRYLRVPMEKSDSQGN